MSAWQAPRIWEGGEVWIIGGGPSVSKQFDIPGDVINEVLAGGSLSLFSEYMKPIHDKHVIGINVAYMLGSWVDIVFFGDRNFFLNHQQRLADFPGLKVSCSSQTDRYNWVKYTPMDYGHPRGISPNPRFVSWNYNSGAASISLAAHLGAKRIILLGFDMKLDETERQHFHNCYGRLNVKNPKRHVGLPFNRHLLGFPEIAKDAQRMRIEIINASPDSAIKDFKKMTVKDILAEEKAKKIKVKEPLEIEV